MSNHYHSLRCHCVHSAGRSSVTVHLSVLLQTQNILTHPSFLFPQWISLSGCCRSVDSLETTDSPRLQPAKQPWWTWCLMHVSGLWQSMFIRGFFVGNSQNNELKDTKVLQLLWSILNYWSSFKIKSSKLYKSVLTSLMPTHNNDNIFLCP